MQLHNNGTDGSVPVTHTSIGTLPSLLTLCMEECERDLEGGGQGRSKLEMIGRLMECERNARCVETECKRQSRIMEVSRKSSGGED